MLIRLRSLSYEILPCTCYKRKTEEKSIGADLKGIDWALNVAETIDCRFRCLIPILFVAFNICYYLAYSQMDDETVTS